MIRKDKKGASHLECSNCKAPVASGYATEAEALVDAERGLGLAVLGKFHFCHECFADMNERWKANNGVVVNEVAHRGCDCGGRCEQCDPALRHND